jgi:hypothetical protein
MRKLAILAAAATAALTLAASASADAPVHYGGTFGPTTLVDSRLCTFPVTVTLGGEFHGLVTPSGRDISLNIRTTTFSAGGRSVSGTSPHVTIFTESAVAVMGLGFRIVVPGTGVLALDTGRAIIDETGISFEAGRHDIVDADAAALCAYLAGA